jgi:hypothetical protein
MSIYPSNYLIIKVLHNISIPISVEKYIQYFQQSQLEIADVLDNSLQSKLMYTKYLAKGYGAVMLPGVFNLYHPANQRIT